MRYPNQCPKLPLKLKKIDKCEGTAFRNRTLGVTTLTSTALLDKAQRKQKISTFLMKKKVSMNLITTVTQGPLQRGGKFEFF